MSPARQHADGHLCKSTTKATTSARDEKTSPYPTAQRVIAVILNRWEAVRDPWDVDLDGRDVRGGQPGTLPDNGQHHAVTGEGRKTEIGQEEGLARHATARVTATIEGQLTILRLPR